MSDKLHKGHRQRLMEKFGKAPDRFYDHEILEALLFYAMPRVDTNPIAHRLLQRFGSIQNIFAADEQSLCSVDGVGVQVATFLRLHGELHRRIDQVKPKDCFLKNSRDAKLFIKDRLSEEGDEVFLYVFMDGLGKVLSVSSYTDGNAQSVGAKILDMVRGAAALRARTLVIGHNHPSGSPRPSDEDKQSTKKLEIFCDMCGVRLLDHVIVAGNDTFSFRDEGLINPPKMQNAKEYTL